MYPASFGDLKKKVTELESNLETITFITLFISKHIEVIRIIVDICFIFMLVWHYLGVLSIEKIIINV